MDSINKFDNWKSSNNDVIKQYHTEWVKKYPEISVLSLESDIHKNTYTWIYSLNKKKDSINIDLFLEIVKYDDYWSINFELILECEDEYLVDNTKDSSLIQDEKHFEKQKLDWEGLNKNIRKICEYLRIWNESFYKEYDFYPLVD